MKQKRQLVREISKLQSYIDSISSGTTWWLPWLPILIDWTLYQKVNFKCRKESSKRSHQTNCSRGFRNGLKSQLLPFWSNNSEFWTFYKSLVKNLPKPTFLLKVAASTGFMFDSIPGQSTIALNTDDYKIFRKNNLFFCAKSQNMLYYLSSIPWLMFFLAKIIDRSYLLFQTLLRKTHNCSSWKKCAFTDPGTFSANRRIDRSLSWLNLAKAALFEAIKNPYLLMLNTKGKLSNLAIDLS